MEDAVKKIINVLIEDNIKIADVDLESIDIADGTLNLFEKIIPDRFCIYDTEVIDDINGYYGVIAEHRDITGGDWNPQDITISGKIDGKVIIKFNHADKTVKWEFDQNDTDYISDGFYTKLESWVSRNLRARFLMLPTGGQDIAFVYLPRDTAKKINKITDKVLTKDGFVDLFRKTENIPEFVWQLFSRDKCPVDCKDSNGETALTAAIKSKNTEKALLSIDVFYVNIILKNDEGETPLQLSRKYDLQEVTKALEERVVVESAGWRDVEIFYKNMNKEQLYAYPRFASMKEIVELIKNNLDLGNVYPYVAICPNLIFSKAKKFEIGHDTLSVDVLHEDEITEPNNKYDIRYSPIDGTDYYKKDCTADEALRYVKEFYS